LKEILKSVYPVYVYESVYRVEKTLSQLQELGYQGEVLIARELSKLHEQYVTGSIYELLEKINTQEIVLK
jgi:16S rRNA (cytidine1402-2'-O)-methyltransferase